jgi:MATE family multidrug resistance protein
MALAKASAQTYYDIRIWIAPIALANLVLSGYLIGQGKTKIVLRAVIAANLLNLFADILLVPILGLNVTGVAIASVLAELLLFVVYVKSVFSVLGYRTLKQWRPFDIEKAMLKLNSSLFLRSFLLQSCLSFMTLYAIRFGDTAVAANAILMQFFLFISFAMDGVAFALESMVGRAFGQQKWQRLRLTVRVGVWMSTVLALAYSLIYLLFNQPIIRLLSNIPDIRLWLIDYQVWIVLFPLVSYMSFIMDGVFVGLAWSKKMLSSMFAAAVVFFTSFALSLELENQGLWLAFCLFMLTRGLVQWYQYRTTALC